MCKRFVTTIAACIAGIVSLFGVLSFSACEKQGEEVNEQQWKAMFDKIITADNYTVNISDNMLLAYDCNAMEMNGIFNEKSAYFELKAGYNESEIADTYISQIWWVKENTQIWQYDKSSYNNGVASSVTLDYFNNFHDMYVQYYQSILSRGFYFSQDGETKTIADSFGEFNFKDGKYSADVYNEQNCNKITIEFGKKKGNKTDNIESMKISITGTVMSSGMEKQGYSNFIFSNFGTSSVTIPADALAAIEAEKAKQ